TQRKILRGQSARLGLKIERQSRFVADKDKFAAVVAHREWIGHIVGCAPPAMLTILASKRAYDRAHDGLFLGIEHPAFDDKLWWKVRWQCQQLCRHCTLVRIDPGHELRDVTL